MFRLPELILTAIVIVVIAIATAGAYQARSHTLSIEQMKIDSKLKAYQLETERKKAEAMLIYAKSLELSCAAELTNEFGEVYTRN